MAGYSRLMGADEEGTLQTLTLYRGVMTELVEQHHGRVVGTAGDSVLAEFASPVQAVRSAVAVQRALAAASLDPSTPGALARFLDIYDRRMLEHTVPYEGMREVLARLVHLGPLAVRRRAFFGCAAR